MRRLGGNLRGGDCSCVLLWFEAHDFNGFPGKISEFFKGVFLVRWGVVVCVKEGK